MTVSEALKSVLKKVDHLKTEQIALQESLGRVLAEPVVAPRDHPPWDNSAMDGFAVRSIDTFKSPIDLKIIEEIPCGTIPARELGEGQCSRIMTGAPLPNGADGIVPIEDTEVIDSSHVRILQSTSKGEYVRSRGEDFRAGQMILSSGTVMRSSELGMSATLGQAMLRVYQRPRVSILATGDELVELGKEPGPGQISNSNTYSLMAQVISAGGIPTILGIARDDSKDLREKIEAGLGSDVLLISGGVSVGKYDFVKDVLGELGIALSFWRVSMKPGHPIVFADHKGCFIFGLPGNPVSTLVTFEEFVRPVLLKMAGHTAIFRSTIQATLREDIQKPKDGKVHFIRAIVDQENGNWMVRTTGPQGSGILSSMVKANSLMVIPENSFDLKTGDSVIVQLLDKGLCERSTPGF